MAESGMETIENDLIQNNINPEDYLKREDEVDRAWYEAEEDITMTNGNELFDSYAEQEVK